MRISDWSSDVCSSDLSVIFGKADEELQEIALFKKGDHFQRQTERTCLFQRGPAIKQLVGRRHDPPAVGRRLGDHHAQGQGVEDHMGVGYKRKGDAAGCDLAKGFADTHGSDRRLRRSEEHTSEIKSNMSISYAVFC